MTRIREEVDCVVVCLCVCVCQSYPMSRPCRGKLLLICNDEFRGGPSLDSGGGQQALPSERLGAETDVDNISTLFRRLQFDIVYHNNLTAAVIIYHVSLLISVVI